MRCIVLLSLFAYLHAADAASQRRLVEELAAKCWLAESATDQEGNVIRVWFSMHEMHRKDQSEKTGLGDEDLLRLADLPMLRSLKLWRMPAGEGGYAVVSRLEHLEEFWQESATQACSPEFVLPLADCKHLRVLAIKHNFSVRGIIPMHRLPAYPELRTLVLDLGSAQRENLPFILRHPQLTHLELHRTTMIAEDMQQIVAGCQQLEELWIKPDSRIPAERRFGHRDLRLIQALPRLRRLCLHQSGILPLPFIDGLDAIVPMTGLKEVDFGGTGLAIDDPSIAALRAARPDLKLTGLKQADP